ncbi:hypothetical protein J6TS7_63460 [Paenibacillus dendritiformis]|nr:hypothetical protein J6TS7_63460 [Paenibacillus dendritiformis]
MFQDIVLGLLQSVVLIIKNTNGDHIIHNVKQSRSCYFRDGDGNILEIISHDYIEEGIIKPVGKLQILYLREIGFPVDRGILHHYLLKCMYPLGTITTGNGTYVASAETPAMFTVE